jgi:hypothetical protein
LSAEVAVVVVIVVIVIKQTTRGKIAVVIIVVVVTAVQGVEGRVEVVVEIAQILQVVLHSVLIAEQFFDVFLELLQERVVDHHITRRQGRGRRRGGRGSCCRDGGGAELALVVFGPF